ncbi:MAG: spore germination protein [Clostridia bacterium]
MDASIVSPILIILVAITAISSFAIPDFSLSFHFRIARFAYILLAFFCGFLGIALGLFVHLALLVSMKSFGVPYLAPYAPITNVTTKGFFLKPIWKREKRATFLDTKQMKKQEPISRKWKYQSTKQNTP